LHSGIIHNYNVVSIKKQVVLILIIKIESLKKAVTPEPSFQMILKIQITLPYYNTFSKKVENSSRG